MGKHFGELAFMRGIVFYKLSHHEQKPFAGAFSQGIPNFVTRTLASVRYWLPQFLGGYFIYKSVETAHYNNARKNPRDFADEVDPDAGEKKCKPKE